MNFTRLQNEILDEAASGPGQQKIRERQEIMLALKARLEAWAAAADQRTNRLRRRDGLMFSMSQTGARGKDLKLGVEFKGKGIGDLTIHPDGRALLQLRPKTRAALPEPLRTRAAQDLHWSRHRADGDIIRKVLEQVRAAGPEVPQEREIQWELFHRLRDDGTDMAGEGFQPVFLAGYPAEIPTWMNLKGEVATSAGNIDLLARGRRPGHLPPFYVFEVKRPAQRSAGASVLQEAVVQGFKYALALTIEANGLRVESTGGGAFTLDTTDHALELRAAYQWLFGVRGKRPSDPERLKFGVVAVTAKADAEGALGDLEAAWARYDHRWVEHLGVLAYEGHGAERTYQWQYRSWVQPSR